MIREKIPQINSSISKSMQKLNVELREMGGSIPDKKEDMMCMLLELCRIFEEHYHKQIEEEGSKSFSRELDQELYSKKHLFFFIQAEVKHCTLLSKPSFAPRLTLCPSQTFWRLRTWRALFKKQMVINLILLLQRKDTSA